MSNHTNPETPKELLTRWVQRLRESQFSHYESAKVLSRYNYFLGIPAVFLSTIVGTSVFASLGKQMEPSIQILVGLTSVLSAVLAALQTFLRFSERADKHRAVAARYGSVRRRVEEVLAVKDESCMADDISAIRLEIDSLSDGAPNLSDRIWQRTQKLLSE